MTKVYKGEETREKILLEAINLFSTHGFDQVSLKMIGDVIGVSQSAVAQHFGTKRNIIFRVRSIVSASNRQYVDQNINTYDKAANQLTDYCLSNLEWGFKNRKLAQIIVLTYYFSFMDKEFQKAQALAVKAATDRVENYVISYFRESGIENLKKTREVADAIHQYAFGLFVREIASQSKMPPSKVIRPQIQNVVIGILKNSTSLSIK